MSLYSFFEIFMEVCKQVFVGIYMLYELYAYFPCFFQRFFEQKMVEKNWFFEALMAENGFCLLNVLWAFLNVFDVVDPLELKEDQKPSRITLMVARITRFWRVRLSDLSRVDSLKSGEEGDVERQVVLSGNLFPAASK